jgi:sugar phosphate isomerase/epimerase
LIKIASMVGAPDLETPTLAPYSGDLGMAFKKLSNLGYDGIELMTKRPSTLDRPALRQLLVENRLVLAGLCTGHVFGEDHLGLVTPELQIDPIAVARLKEFIDLAAWLGPGTLVNIGRSRGLGDPQRKEATLHTAAAAIQELSDYARPMQVRIILEPVNRKEARYVHSTREGIELVHQVNRPNFGLMLDTYHMYLEDTDMIASLYDAAPFCWHLHISDSNRCYPGSGAIQFDRVIAALNDLGFNGFIGTEIQPWPDPDSAARLSIEYLRKLVPLAKIQEE